MILFVILIRGGQGICVSAQFEEFLAMSEPSTGYYVPITSSTPMNCDQAVTSTHPDLDTLYCTCCNLYLGENPCQSQCDLYAESHCEFNYLMDVLHFEIIDGGSPGDPYADDTIIATNTGGGNYVLHFSVGSGTFENEVVVINALSQESIQWAGPWPVTVTAAILLLDVPCSCDTIIIENQIYEAAECTSGWVIAPNLPYEGCGNNEVCCSSGYDEDTGDLETECTYGPPCIISNPDGGGCCEGTYPAPGQC